MITNTMTLDLSLGAVQISPQSLAPGSFGTGGLDMQKFLRAMFLLNVGAFGVAATVDMKLQESNDSTFAVGTTDITGAVLTQLLAAGGDNKMATIEVKVSQLTKRYVRALVTVGVAATLISVTPVGCNPVNDPANQNDVAAAVQRVKLTTGQVHIYTPSGLLINDL
jgi:hypothetical protein